MAISLQQIEDRFNVRILALRAASYLGKNNVHFIYEGESGCFKLYENLDEVDIVLVEKSKFTIDNCKIVSVKRMSDGEVFRLSDYVGCRCEGGGYYAGFATCFNYSFVNEEFYVDARMPMSSRSIPIESVIKTNNKSSVSDRPPLGVMPLKYHNEKRAVDLKNAIVRYIDSGEKHIPAEWLKELRNLEPNFLKV